MADLSASRERTPVRTLHLSEITENPNISSTARLMYVMLRSQMGSDGTVAIYARDLARKLGVGEKTVQGLNAELRRHHAIETRGQGTGMPLRYVMLGFAGAALSVFNHAHAVNIMGYCAEKPVAAVDPGNSVHPDTTGGDFSGGEPLSDSPSRVSLNTQAHAAPARFNSAECVLFENLKNHGVAVTVAADLVSKWPDRVEAWLIGIEWRRNVGNVPGYLVRAITENYPVPKALEEFRERSALPKKHAPPELTRLEQEHLKQQERRATDAMLSTVPSDVNYILGLKADDQVDTGILGRVLPPEMRRKAKRARYVELVREYLATGQVPA